MIRLPTGRPLSRQGGAPPRRAWASDVPFGGGRSHPSPQRRRIRARKGTPIPGPPSLFMSAMSVSQPPGQPAGIHRLRFLRVVRGGELRPGRSREPGVAAAREVSLPSVVLFEGARQSQVARSAGFFRGLCLTSSTAVLWGVFADDLGFPFVSNPAVLDSVLTLSWPVGRELFWGDPRYPLSRRVRRVGPWPTKTGS